MNCRWCANGNFHPPGDERNVVHTHDPMVAVHDAPVEIGPLEALSLRNRSSVTSLALSPDRDSDRHPVLRHGTEQGFFPKSGTGRPPSTNVGSNAPSLRLDPSARATGGRICSLFHRDSGQALVVGRPSDAARSIRSAIFAAVAGVRFAYPSEIGPFRKSCDLDAVTGKQ